MNTLQDIAPRRIKEPVLPQFMGSYRLQRLIGEGAMGRVYQAEHVLLGRVVALKVLHPDLALRHKQQVFARLVDEARAANLARSDHVVDVIDLCLDFAGDTYLVMELVEGESLATLCRRGGLSVQRSLEIVRQLAEALSVVHAAGIVHRDLKPDNIMVTQRAHRDHVKILDFRVAKLNVVGHFETMTTQPGWIVGTPQYMSPEQATGGAVDHRSDLYALGTILFELLTGTSPFHEVTVRELLSRMASTPAPRLGAYVQLRCRGQLSGQALRKTVQVRRASSAERRQARRWLDALGA